MPTLPFTIDAELLRELGERLVGKPHVALAELIKNSYDADATQVTIKFLPDKDRIEISDDGHGMTFNEFKNFWMRIGTTHKREKRRPINLDDQYRFQGWGRWQSSFRESLTIQTVPKDKGRKWLKARIDWEKSLEAEELTEVKVAYDEYDRNSSDMPYQQGTLILLEGLKDEWNGDAIRDLASEVWWLQPPFGSALSSMDNPKIF